MLPRIPLVGEAKYFWGFSKAGRKLSDLHINYEKVALYKSPGDYATTDSLSSKGPKSPGDYGLLASKYPDDPNAVGSKSPGDWNASADKTTVCAKSPGDYYWVEKMRFPKKDQKDMIIYNGHITIENIPAEAYEYIVNGKSAIKWVMERYQVTTHKESGIRNNPNDWATEVGNPRYILDLLLSVINVSVKTVEIVKGLPKVEFE